MPLESTEQVNYDRFLEALFDPTVSPLSDRSLQALNGFNVHRNTVHRSLIEALGQNFPSVFRQIGAEHFERLAVDYLRSYPPRSAVLVEYGSFFPQFIYRLCAKESDDSIAHRLAELASIDWLCQQSAHQLDHEPIAASEFHSLVTEPERLALSRIQFAPSMSLVFSCSGAIDLWESLQSNDLDTARFMGSSDPKAAVISRKAYRVELHPVDWGAAQFLGYLSLGETIGRAHAQSDSFDLTSTFALLLQRDMVTAIDSDARRSF